MMMMISSHHLNIIKRQETYRKFKRENSVHNVEVLVLCCDGKQNHERHVAEFVEERHDHHQRYLHPFRWKPLVRSAWFWFRRHGFNCSYCTPCSLALIHCGWLGHQSLTCVVFDLIHCVGFISMGVGLKRLLAKNTSPRYIDSLLVALTAEAVEKVLWR